METKWAMLLSVLFVLVLGIIALYYKPSQSLGTDTDFIAINRPSLLATLIIDSTNAPGVRYHYELENSGILPAQLRSFGEQVPGASLSQNAELPNKQEILRHGKMDLHTVLGDGGAPPPITGSTFSISYSAKIKGRDRMFASAYHFAFPAASVHPGSIYNPISPEKADNVPLPYPQQLAKALAAENAGAMFVFNVNTNTPSTRIVGKNKVLLIDTMNEIVVFESVSYNGQVLAVCRHLEIARSRFHIITLDWTTNSIKLGVDSHFVSDPSDPPAR